MAFGFIGKLVAKLTGKKATPQPKKAEQGGNGRGKHGKRGRHGAKGGNTDSDMQLVVVGSRYWWGDELAAAYDGMRFRSDVRFIGHADSSELSHLMSASTALVYASLFEGFGIPILEAFCAETAVITSNNTSMPEVAGDAALLVDPLSVKSISDAMSRVANDAELRNVLIARGRERRTLFSWERTASLLWESMMRTCENIQT